MKITDSKTLGALISAGNELAAMGVKQTDEISERILSSGGISRYL